MSDRRRVDADSLAEFQNRVKIVMGNAEAQGLIHDDHIPCVHELVSVSTSLVEQLVLIYCDMLANDEEHPCTCTQTPGVVCELTKLRWLLVGLILPTTTAAAMAETKASEASLPMGVLRTLSEHALDRMVAIGRAAIGRPT